MKNDTCVICGKQFDKPRAGKLYCSDKCKQAAFDMKIHSTGKPEIIKEEPTHNVKLDRLYQFNLFEFEQVKEKFKIEADIYWFLRKNLSGPVDLDQIISHVRNFTCGENGQYFYENYQKLGHPLCKSFDDFVSVLHGPGVQFYYDENLNSKSICISL
ncbi:hypothetical protein ES708_22044 [subsurface metagenome]